MPNDAVNERAEARRAANAAKKQANKDAWKTHPANANAAWMQKQAELESAAPIAVDLPPVAETGSLPRLRGIMADQDQPLHRRLDAAEVILQYELAPAALVNAHADAIAVSSLQFMRAVADAQDAPDALRFRALRNIASIENARASRADPNEAENRRRRLVFLINAARRQTLHELGLWVRPPGSDWCINHSDVIEPLPERPPADERQNSSGRGEDRQWLLSIRARNRFDNWDEIIQQGSVT